MHPVVVSLGPITIYSFGVMLALAFLAAGAVAQREMARKGLDPELASSFLFWAAVGGLVGSRVLSFVNDWSAFVEDPLAFLITGAGFVFYGGLAGGFLTVSILIWRHGLPWLKVVDCIAPALAIGQAIGRVGCLLAGDGDWGTPTTLPWGMRYPNAIIGWDEWVAANDLEADVRVHPAPIYETILYGLIFAFLWSRRRVPRPDGTRLWQYLVLSGAARFLVEIVRIEPRLALGLTEAQWISVALIAIGGALLLRGQGGQVAVARAPARSAGPRPE